MFVRINENVCNFLLSNDSGPKSSTNLASFFLSLKNVNFFKRVVKDDPFLSRYRNISTPLHPPATSTIFSVSHVGIKLNVSIAFHIHLSQELILLDCRSVRISTPSSIIKILSSLRILRINFILRICIRN